MSYLDHNAAFALAGGIQELSIEEVEEVEGAALPAVGAAIAAARACSQSPKCVAVVVYVADKAVDVILDQIFS